MIFSSLVFLYLFLPIVLLGFYLVRKQYRNGFLLLSSIVFFAWGGVSYTFILLLSIVLNYLFGLWLGASIGRRKKNVLFLGVGVNLLILGIFKYANFFCWKLECCFRLVGNPSSYANQYCVAHCEILKFLRDNSNEQTVHVETDKSSNIV